MRGCSNEPSTTDRMSKQRQQRERNYRDPFESPRPPGNRQPEAGQPQRQVIVQETHVEGKAVSQHSDERREKPWGPFRDRSNEREYSPEKNQHAGRDNYFLVRYTPE